MKNNLIAHKNNQKLKRYTKSELAIIGAIRQMTNEDGRGRYTMHQIAKFMTTELNCISGRFGRMVDKEILIKDGRQSYKRHGFNYPRTLFRLVQPKIECQFKPGMEW